MATKAQAGLKKAEELQKKNKLQLGVQEPDSPVTRAAKLASGVPDTDSVASVVDPTLRARAEANPQTALLGQELLAGKSPSSFQVPQEQPQEKGFLLENVSTATGIAGGVAGSLLGPAGTVAGAGLGAGLGESVENIAMGDPLGKNVLKTAAIDAALTLTGLGVVKLIKYGARLLLPGGELMVPAVTKMAAGTSRVSEYTGFLTKQRGVLTSELASDTSGTVAKRIQGIDKALHKLKISDAVPKVIGGLEGTEKEFFTQATKKLGRESLNYFDETSFNVWKNPKTARAGLSYLNTLAQGAKNPRFVLASLVAMGSLSIGTGVYWFTQTGNDTGDAALQLAMMANEAKNSPNKEEVIRNIRELSNDLADPAILEGLNALNYPKAVARKISYANQYVNLIADNIASEGNNK